MTSRLTTFEKCEMHRNRLLGTIGEVLTYNSWSNKFKQERIKELANIPFEWNVNYGNMLIDPTELTRKELDFFDFGTFDEQSEFRLIPLWLYPYLVENFNAICIDGTKTTTKQELDTEHRYGYLAYGVIPAPDHSDNEE